MELYLFKVSEVLYAPQPPGIGLSNVGLDCPKFLSNSCLSKLTKSTRHTAPVVGGGGGDSKDHFFFPLLDGIVLIYSVCVCVRGCEQIHVQVCGQFR